MPVYSPAFAGTHLPTPEGWHAELALVHTTQQPRAGVEPVTSRSQSPAPYHSATAYPNNLQFTRRFRYADGQTDRVQHLMRFTRQDSIIMKRVQVTAEKRSSKATVGEPEKNVQQFTVQAS